MYPEVLGSAPFELPDVLAKVAEAARVDTQAVARGRCVPLGAGANIWPRTIGQRSAGDGSAVIY